MRRLTLEDFNSSVDSSVSKLKSSLVPVFSNNVKNNEQRNLSIFIPCFQLTEKRKRNLEFTYNRLSERDFHIVLAVQGEYDEYYNKFTNAEVRFFAKEGDFNKSFILNLCLDLVKNNFFVFLDIDVYFNFDSLHSLTFNDEIVKPFTECTYLNDELTQEFIEKRSVKIPINSKKASALGGGALAIRSDLIRSKNLRFDEQFTGWGWEDIDFGDQIRSKGLRVRTIEQPAVHLYHEPLKPNEYNNSLYYKSKSKIKNKIVHIFSSENSDQSSINSFVKYKTSDVLLIDCAKFNQVDNPNVKFIQSNKIYSGRMVELASEFVSDQGWIVCTQGFFVAHDKFYSELSNKTEDYLVLGQAEGFAIRFKSNKSSEPIYLKVINGLANRLRSICSFAKFAENNNRQLFVNWSGGQGFSDNDFTDFFESWPSFVHFISDKEYLEKTDKLLKLHQVIDNDKIKPELYSHTEDIVEKMEGEFCYEGHSCLEYMLSEYFYGNYNDTNFLQRLVPTKEISEKVNKICQYFDENTFGVHIRRGDSSFCEWKKYYRVSTINSFIRLIEEQLSIRPDANFYLSTDCPETEDLIKSKFKNKVLCQSKPFYLFDDYGLAKPFQKEALIDLICLSKTKKIIGSYWSSFSTLASHLSEIPLEIATQSYKQNVSVIAAVKNRTEALKISLQSWLRFDEIAEIIIIDWSSDISLEFLEKIDDRIKVVVVKNKELFNMSLAFNLASRIATKDFILKMDADYILSPYYSIFDYKLKPTEFLTGHYENAKTDNNLGFLSNLNGMIFIRNLDFKSVGGYDEFFTDYGYEDCDLYNRLEKAGYSRTLLDHKTIDVFHIPHSDDERIKHYKNKNIKESLRMNVSRSLNRCKSVIFSCKNPDLKFDKTISNIGNFIHEKGACDLITENKIFAPDLNYDPKEINKRGKILIVPSSNFLGNYFNKSFINFLEQINIPILFIGLGIASDDYNPPLEICDESKRLINLIKEKKYAVGTRGNSTTSFLQSYGISNIFETGCPSNFLNKDPNLYSKIVDKFSKNNNNIVINQNDIFSPNQQKVMMERILFSFSKSDKDIIVQQAQPFMNLLQNEKDFFKDIKIAIDPLSKISDFEQMLYKYKHYDSISSWTKDLSMMDLSVGLRMHGNMLAMQSGCPTIWIYHDIRTKELCETMSLPRISLESAVTCSSLEDIKNKAIINFEEYAKTRLILKRKTRELLEQFGLN